MILKKVMKKLPGLLALLGMTIFVFLGVISCLSTRRMYTGSESLYWKWDHVLGKLLFGGVLILLWLLIGKAESWLTDRRMFLAAILVSCMVTVFCIALTWGARSEPDADQWYVYVAAEGLFRKDYTKLQTYVYYMVFPHQLGLAKLYATIAWTVGSISYEILRFVQAFCAGFSVFFLFLITRERFKSVRAECICLLCCGAFVPLALYTQFLYGESIGVSMVLGSIWFFLLGNRQDLGRRHVRECSEITCEDLAGRAVPNSNFGNCKLQVISAQFLRILYWGLAIIVFGIAYLLRPALVVAWIAMALIQAAWCLRNKKLLPMLGIVLMLTAGVGGQKAVLGNVGKTAGVVVDNAIPLAFLSTAMGMQDYDPFGYGAGSYNGYGWNTFAETGWDQEESVRRALQDMKRTLYQWIHHPSVMCTHIFEKVLNQWTEPAYGAFTMTCKMEDPDGWVEDLYYNDLHEFVYALLDCIQTFCYFSLATWFWHLFRAGRWGRETAPQDYLIGLILIGEFFFSILWEAKSRYVFPYMVIIIPCAAGSFSCFCHRMTTLLRQRLRWF